MTPKWLGIFTLLLAMVMESLAQVALKIGSSGGARALATPYNRWAQILRVATSARSWIVIGVVFYTVQIFLWTYVLHLLPLSIAFPMASLCFVGVALLSKILLAERVGRARWLGILFILLGTVFLAL